MLHGLVPSATFLTCLLFLNADLGVPVQKAQDARRFLRADAAAGSARHACHVAIPVLDTGDVRVQRARELVTLAAVDGEALEVAA